MSFRIISKPGCKFCDRAIQILTAHGISFEIDRRDTEEGQEAFRQAGYLTYPQIWDGDYHVGGYNNLVEYLDF